MATRALIMLGGASNSPLYVQAAQRLGLRPITLSADPTCYDYLAAVGIEAIRVDGLDALIRECSRLRATYDIAGIVSAQELVYATVGNAGTSICQDRTPHRLNDAATNSFNVRFSRRLAFQYMLIVWRRMGRRLKALLRRSACR